MCYEDTTFITIPHMRTEGSLAAPDVLSLGFSFVRRPTQADFYCITKWLPVFSILLLSFLCPFDTIIMLNVLYDILFPIRVRSIMERAMVAVVTGLFLIVALISPVHAWQCYPQPNPCAPRCAPPSKLVTKMVPCVKTEIVADVVPYTQCVPVKKIGFRTQKVLLKGTPVGQPCGLGPCTKCCPSTILSGSGTEGALRLLRDQEDPFLQHLLPARVQARHVTSDVPGTGLSRVPLRDVSHGSGVDAIGTPGFVTADRAVKNLADSADSG